MKKDLTRPCCECPFRKSHPPGWLGPWTPESLAGHLKAGNDFACHRTIPDDYKHERDANHPRPQHCAGASIHLNNQFAVSRDRDTADHQQLLEDVPNVVKNSVFKWSHEFVRHHNREKA